MHHEGITFLVHWLDKEKGTLISSLCICRIFTWESDLCQGCPDGLGWLLQELLLLLVNELIEHIELFLDPRDKDGLEGGVASDHCVTSQPFISVITCSDAGGKWCGEAACRCNWSETSWRCVSSISIAISSSYVCLRALLNVLLRNQVVTGLVATIDFY